VTASEKSPPPTPPRLPTPPPLYREATPPTPEPRKPETPKKQRPPSPMTSKPRRPKIRHKGRKYAAVMNENHIDFDTEFPQTYKGRSVEEEFEKLVKIAEESDQRLHKHNF
jgi:hypothetical protein